MKFTLMKRLMKTALLSILQNPAGFTTGSSDPGSEKIDTRGPVWQNQKNWIPERLQNVLMTMAA
jgi:hypothetical protein